jgi:hypothetical protein
MTNSRIERIPETSVASNPTPIGRAIEELMRSLGEYCRRMQNPDLHPDSRLASWKDEDYHYVETKVEGTEVSHCDINILDGKVFIRFIPDDEIPATAGLPRIVPLLD